MVGKRLGLLLPILLLVAAVGVFPELNSSVKISTLTGLARYGRSAALTGLAKSSLDLWSTGNKNVKGFLQLDTIIANGFSLGVPRAYVKVRFPWFRTTLGKTRVSWGEGFLFNAGDVIFNGMDLEVSDFTSSVLREETDWLWEVYLPLGRFSYLEGVLLPYSANAGDPARQGFTPELASLLQPVMLEDVSAGGRWVAKWLGIKWEGGYLHHGESRTHRPYVSLQGHLLVDWNLSSSLEIPVSGPEWQDLDRWLAVSAGLFHLARLPSGDTLSLRLESAFRPGGEWEEASGGLAPDADYGLYLFPELSYSRGENLSLQLRSLLSPLDLSALLSGGVNWKVYQGLSVLSYLTVMLGDKSDRYGWERDGGSSWVAGLEYIY